MPALLALRARPSCPATRPSAEGEEEEGARYQALAGIPEGASPDVAVGIPGGAPPSIASVVYTWFKGTPSKPRVLPNSLNT